MAIRVVRDVLVAASAVTTLVPADRITPLIRYQSIAPPAVTLSRVSLVASNGLRGSASLDANRVQLDVWAETYESARAIAAACRAALQAATWQMQLERDDYDPEVDPRLYRVTQDWLIWTT